MEKNKVRRRRKFIGTPLQKKILILVFSAAVIPTTLAVAILYYLIFNLLSWQMAIPEAIAFNLIPVSKKINMILLVALPVVFLLLWVIALELSHRIAGPLFRIERELDERIAGNVKGEIKLRPKDDLKGLAVRINKLLSKS
ncbi:MAG: hypothetical protein AB1481_04125 [Candidatus Omnitrophota bacterium]